MRKLKLFTVAFALGMTSLFASENIEDLNKEIRYQVVELLSAAEFETDKDVNINLTFTFNSYGEIVVLNIASDSMNKDVKEFIRDNVNYKKIQNPGLENQNYSLPINVKAIQ